MTTQAIFDLVKQAISELPTDSVGDATRMAFAVLDDNTLVPSRKVPARLDQVIKNLEAIRAALLTQYEAPEDVDRRLRQKLDLTITVPPFDLEKHEAWLSRAQDFHEHATDTELPELAKALYEEYSGILPPGPLDYTRQ